MLKNNRVLAALNHQETDTVPFNIGFTEQAYKNMLEYSNDPAFLDKADRHLNYIAYCGRPRKLMDNNELYKDDFGVVWDRSGADKDIGMPIEKLIKNFDDIDYVFPELDEKLLRFEYEELIKNKKDEFTFGGIGFTMFERAWSLAGMPETLMAMITNPEGVHKLMDMICEYNLKIIDIALEYDIDGFYFGDDWGQQKGLIMGPDLWRKFIKPRMERMYSKIKEKNLYVFQHSCGDVESIFEDLIEIGLDCYQTFQPEIYDNYYGLENIKSKYGSRLTFWGGISTQQLLPKASVEEIKNEIVRIINIMSTNGGFIVAPTHAIEFDVPAKSIIAMLEVFQNQDKYIK